MHVIQKRKYSRYRVPLIFTLVLLLGLFLPVRFPTSVETYGRIVPGREWLLVRDPAGRIAALTCDRVANRTESLLAYEFERQDAVRFILHPGVPSQGAIHAGDTVGILSSAEAERQLAQLEGALLQAGSTMKIYQSGEKEAIQKAAEERVAHARTRYEGHRRTVLRMRTLLERGIIAAQEYEPIEAAGDLYEAEIRIAESELLAVKTGAKQAERELGESGAKAIEKEIAVLRSKMELFTFIAPFTGTIYNSSLSDTLFRVGDSKNVAVVFPVPWKERFILREGGGITVTVPHLSTGIAGVVRSIGNVVHTIGNEQVILVTAVIDNTAEKLMPGLSVSCSIEGPKTSVRAILGRFFANLFSR